MVAPFSGQDGVVDRVAAVVIAVGNAPAVLESCLLALIAASPAVPVQPSSPSHGTSVEDNVAAGPVLDPGSESSRACQCLLTLCQFLAICGATSAAVNTVGTKAEQAMHRLFTVLEATRVFPVLSDIRAHIPVEFYSIASKYSTQVLYYIPGSLPLLVGGSLDVLTPDVGRRSCFFCRWRWNHH